MAIKIIISGDVQGILFRAFLKSRALELGLRGTVQNLPDGSVEVIAQGPQDALDELIKKCWKGPALANVKDVKVKKQKDQEFDTFSIIY